jgi:hypothetical protein
MLVLTSARDTIMRELTPDELEFVSGGHEQLFGFSIGDTDIINVEKGFNHQTGQEETILDFAGLKFTF